MNPSIKMKQSSQALQTFFLVAYFFQNPIKRRKKYFFCDGNSIFSVKIIEFATLNACMHKCYGVTDYLPLEGIMHYFLGSQFYLLLVVHI